MPIGIGKVVLDGGHRKAEKPVELAHPLGVPTSKVVVHRYDVSALADEGVEVDRECSDKGLTLAGLHLGYVPLMKHHPTDELHVEVTHVEHASAGFPAYREGLG